MSGNSMHNLTTLIKRLEAATSRLEDIASSTMGADQTATPGHQTSSTAAGAGATSAALEKSQSAPAPSSGSQEELPASLEDFDTLINGDLRAFHDQSKAMGGLLAEQGDMVVKAFEAERQVLLIATKSKKPEMSAPVYMDILQDLQKQMTAVDNIRQNNRSSEYKDHLAMVADGVGALAWVSFESDPVDSVGELFGGAQIFGNKVLRLYKDKEESHVEWVKSFYKVMRSLIAYIKQHHLRGLQWNPQGVDPAQALKSSSAAPTPTATPTPSGFGSNAPPPPPMPAGGIPQPPPPPPPGGGAASNGGKSTSDMGAVFADLNKGDKVTSGLKKVDPSMQTHKNPSLRATSYSTPSRSDSTGSGRGKSPAPPGKKPKPETLRTKKPPRKELDGNKWYIENHDPSPEPITITVEINQSILITKCQGSTIQIKGKANAITIDNSSKTNLIVDSLVSSVDVIKCPSFALQILGAVPTILLDQVDGGTIYLSKDSLGSEVFTSKCTAINVYLPPAKEEDDYREESVPEQFRSFIRDGRLVTEIVEHAG